MAEDLLPTPSDVERRRSDRLRFLPVFAIGCLLVAAAITVVLLTTPYVGRIDGAIKHVPDPDVHGPRWLVVVTDLGNPVADPIVVTLLAIGLIPLLGLRPARFVLAAYLPTIAAVYVLKVLIARPAPGKDELNTLRGYFPSGHTASATCACALLVVVVAWASRGEAYDVTPALARGALLGGLVGGAVIGTSTVVTGYHHTSDVVAALVLTLGIVALALWAFAPQETQGSARRDRQERRTR